MNLLASVLRTVVPLLAGWILTVTGALGIEADSTVVAGGITAAVTLAYYTLLRLAEELASRIGWEPGRLIAGLFLGWARPPAYEQPTATVPVRVHFDKEALRLDVGEALRRAAQDVERRRP
ncbi:hypothetical protein [Streptomyces nymphaeiformis]|jgi:hypothetical protein|uniref:Uncharacterized protein n=1 Tax=Streptomyces nymphaeiformis TaxID=2663842 RepID=A0A7W7U9U5_9ACTN|nr:hypothetical protein [Streptomyces nymphaeiformis]MBB4987504.1 hypothetical protein [Streptomyces nymphaeiformis]